MGKNKSFLRKDTRIKGNLIEKEGVVVDGEIQGNITAEEVELFENSKVKGNIKSKLSEIGGNLKGDIDSDKVHIKKTADITGSISQKTISIEEGANLKIRTETKNKKH
tara:strand:- start:164 stop:487 length:324 start_codon:yes stop_codon:yes gene_type:complete